jgi:hypothetical protein
MTFGAPLFLLAAGFASAIVGLLHLIAALNPRTYAFPTARFVPDSDVSQRQVVLRPRDLLLLALRIGIIMAVGLGLARPQVRPAPTPLIRIVVADRSRNVGNIHEVADSASALLAHGSRLVLFDSAATAVADHPLDSLHEMRPTMKAGNLSAALVVALRAASLVRDDADSIEIDVVSPILRGELDEATDSVRALWPAAMRLVPVSGAGVAAPTTVVMLGALQDDPLRAAIIETDTVGAATRVRRDAPTSRDSSWVRGGARALVFWPDDASTGKILAGGSPWTNRSPADTVGAVMAGNAVVVAPFVRYASFGSNTGSTGLSSLAPDDHVIARWVDGAPAAMERQLGLGCIRTVTIPVPRRGDLVLTTRFDRLVAFLTGPCGGPAMATVGATELEALARPTLPRRASGGSIARAEAPDSPWMIWLLLAALVGMPGELLLRNRTRR